MRVRGTERIWAGGDCVEVLNLVSGALQHIALGTHANKHGRVIGVNIGGGYATFPGVVGTAVSKVCDVEIARTGLKESQARAAGLDFVTAVVESTSRAGYYPDAALMTVKMLAERGTGRLLGLQIVGGEGAAKRVDVGAVALTAGMTAGGMVDLDLGYAPPFSPVWDPVLVAARKAADAVADGHQDSGDRGEPAERFEQRRERRAASDRQHLAGGVVEQDEGHVVRPGDQAPAGPVRAHRTVGGTDPAGRRRVADVRLRALQDTADAAVRDGGGLGAGGRRLCGGARPGRGGAAVGGPGAPGTGGRLSAWGALGSSVRAVRASSAPQVRPPCRRRRTGRATRASAPRSRPRPASFAADPTRTCRAG